MSVHLSANVGNDTVSTEGEELTCETAVRVDVDRDESNLPKHLALCIDSSNSMDGRKIRYAQEGIKRAVDVLDDRDFVSVVEFSGSVSRVLDPTQCGSNRNQIKREIDSISTSGGTNIIAGMKEAKSALNDKSNGGLLGSVLADNDEEFIEWIVLVSDGNPTTVPDFISTLMPHKSKADRHISVAEEFADDGVTVQSVGVGNDYNEAIMRGVAEATRGKMEHISDPEQIRTFFEEIVAEADDIVGVNPTLQIQPKDGVSVGEVYQHEPVLNELDPDRHRGILKTGLPDIGADVDQEILIEFEVPPDDPGTERLVLEIELNAAGEIATDSVVVEYSEGGTEGLTVEDQKRIDTKARRLAIEESPDTAMSYLDRHDEAVVLEETRDHIERLKRAGGNDDETLKLKNELTRPGLTKPSDATIPSEPETTDPNESDEPRREEPTDTGDSTAEKEHTESHSGSEGDEPVEREADDDPAVESIDTDTDETDTDESPDSEDSDQTEIALIPSEETITAGRPLDLEVRDETGGRVADATITHPDGTTSTDDRGTCTVRLTVTGDIELQASKDGSYGTDTATVTVREGLETEDSADIETSSDTGSNTDSGDNEVATEIDERETSSEGSNREPSKEPRSVVPIPEKTTVPTGEAIEFTVRDAQGNRVRNAVVDADGKSEKTDDRGRCRFTFDSVGTYEVTVVDVPEAPSESDVTTITVESGLKD
jgi:Ca-activated chloride channel family protein